MAAVSINKYGGQIPYRMDDPWRVFLGGLGMLAHIYRQWSLFCLQPANTVQRRNA